MTRVRQLLIAALLVWLAPLAACGGDSKQGAGNPVCEAAAEFERTRDEANALRRENPGDVASINRGVIKAFARLAETLPPEIQPDARLIQSNISATLSGSRPKSDADDSVNAAKRLNAFVDSNCPGGDEEG